MLWQFVTDGPLRAAAAEGHDGLLYTVSDRRLWAIDPSGAERWNVELTGRPAGGPVIGNTGTVLVTTRIGQLLAVGASGQVVWQRRLSGPACTSPTVSGLGLIYVATCAGTVHAFSPIGQPRWLYQLQSAVESTPVVAADGTVLALSADRKLHAVGRDGTKRWEVAVTAGRGGLSLTADGDIYVSGFGVQRVSGSGVVLWTFPLSSATTGVSISVDGSLLVATLAGRLYGLNPDGSKRWETLIGAALETQGATLIDGGAWFSSTKGGLLHVAADGDTVIRQLTQTAMTAPLATASGVVYVGSENWSFYAIDGAAPAADTPWTQLGQSGRRQGSPPLRPAAARPEVVLLQQLAVAPGATLKQATLARIKEVLDSGAETTLDLDSLEWGLQYLAREITANPSYVGGQVTNDHPEVRQEAIALLGRLGTRTALDTLLEVIETDPDQAVRIAAIRAAAEVGVDPDGRVAGLLIRQILSVRGDPAGYPVVAASVAAFDQIRVLNHRLTPEGYQALLAVMTGNYPRALRDAARGVLEAAVRDPLVDQHDEPRRTLEAPR